MARKRYTAEEIIGHLRTIEIENGQRGRDRGGLSEVGDHGIELRDEWPNGELFCTLQEARVIVEVGPHFYLARDPRPSSEIHSCLRFRQT